MSRSKNVKPDDARKLLSASLRNIVEALLSRTGRKQLRAHADEVAKYWQKLDWLQQFLNQKPRPTKAQLEAVFQPLLSGPDAGHSIAMADLRLFEAMLSNTAAGLIGNESPGVLSPQALGRFLLRTTSRKGTLRGLKPEFVAAFQARVKALSEGRDITVRNLAMEFTRIDYERNPESAMSKMHRGLLRVQKRTALAPEKTKIKNRTKR